MIQMRLATQLSVAAILLLMFLMIPNMLTHPVRALPDVTNVTVSGFSFNPKNTTILEGDTVMWTNNDPVIHTLWFVNITDQTTFLLSPPIMPGESWSQNFTETATLQYYSFDRLWITGFLTVSSIIHDVAVTQVTATPTAVKAGETVSINVTVTNQGNITEMFDVSAYFDTDLIGTQTGISINASESKVVLFSWDTSDVAGGTYTISAEASQVPAEINLTNNKFTDGTVTINPLQIPVASFVFSPASLIVGDTVTFNASASYDPDGTIVSYFWYFGDGANSTETDPIATHAYTEPETYTITLEVTDNDGLTKTATKDITVSSPPPFPLEIIVVIAVVIVLILGVALYYYMKKRGSS